jgi:hypothetical protein
METRPNLRSRANDRDNGGGGGVVGIKRKMVDAEAEVPGVRIVESRRLVAATELMHPPKHIKKSTGFMSIVQPSSGSFQVVLFDMHMYLFISQEHSADHTWQRPETEPSNCGMLSLSNYKLLSYVPTM